MLDLDDFISKVRPEKTVIVANNHMKEGYRGKYIDVGEPFTSHMPWLPQLKFVFDVLLRELLLTSHLSLELRVLSNEPGPGYATVASCLKENPVSTLIFAQKGKVQTTRDHQRLQILIGSRDKEIWWTI